MSSKQSTSGSDKYWIWFIILIAAVLRILYLIAYSRLPEFSSYMWDAQEYHSMAIHWSKGEVPPEFPWRAPLFPFLLGAIYAIFGTSPIIPRIFELVISVWSCIIVFRIGVLIEGKTAGIVAALFTAASGLMVYFSFELLPTGLFVFFLLLYVQETLRLHSGNGNAIHSGIWLGFAILTRPVALIFLPLTIIYWIIIKKPAISIVKLSLPPIALMFIMLLVHLAHGDGAVLVSAQGGVNFYIGNNRVSDGMTANLPETGPGWGWDTISKIADRESNTTESSSTPAEVDQFFYRKGFQEITSDIPSFFGLIGKKMLLFWSRDEISSNRDLYFHAEKINVMKALMVFTIPWLLPLAIPGLVIMSGNREKGRYILFLILSYYLATVLFFVNSRFRIPVYPLLALSAAVFISQIQMYLKDSGKSFKFNLRSVAITAGVLFGLMLPHLAETGIEDRSRDYGYFTQGQMYFKQGEYRLAKRAFLNALDENRNAPYVNYYLSELALQHSNISKSIQHLRRELTIQPGFATAWNTLGVNYMKTDRADSALVCFKRALANDPSYTEARQNIGRYWMQKALKALDSVQVDQSRRYIRKALEFDPQNPYYRIFLLEIKISDSDTLGIRNELDTLKVLFPDIPEIEELRNRLDEF